MNTIENIWNEIEKGGRAGKPNADDGVLRKAALEKCEAIRNLVGKEHHLVVEDYEEQMYALADFHEQQAFEKGVSFAVRFIFDALSEKN